MSDENELIFFESHREIIEFMKEYKKPKGKRFVVSGPIIMTEYDYNRIKKHESFTAKELSDE